jgi:putative DNA primase/helicase
MNDNDPFAPLTGPSSRKTAENKPTWTPVKPVPLDAPPPPATHPKLGKPRATWTYTDATGGTLGHVLRFDAPGGDKVFRPLVFMKPTTGSGRPEWRWESWPPKRPLYGLQRLAERPSAAVVVTEGEKAADAIVRLLPGFVAVTSPNGSKSAGKADWSPLRGRAVTVWPDADVAGIEYANQVAKLATAAGAHSVAIVSPPTDCKVGFDAADALADGWDEAATTAFIATAKPFTPVAAGAGKTSSTEKENTTEQEVTGGRRRTPQRDMLIALTELAEFWHDAGRAAFVTFPVRGHRENWPMRSREFRMWLSGQFYEATGGAIGGQALEDGIRILEARAVNAGPEYEPFIRVGRQDGKLYLDLCDSRWRAVEITTVGWGVVEKPPLKLLRSPSMRPLPEPEAGNMIEVLRRFFMNVRSNDDFILVTAWLVAALRDRGPYPVLVVNGEQGAGKSVFCRMLRLLADPSAAPIRAVPKDDRDLVVSAGNSWILAYDNLSTVPAWLSDALCRLATGGGFATRMLHTDRDEMIFEATRPIILNGISSLTDRADLADRAVTIHLQAIPEEERLPEDELWADFEKARPQIVGALLDAVSAALRNVATVRLDRSPRMADFVKWITAAESGLGWEPGQFLAVYRENRCDVAESSFEADPVAVAIRDYVTTEHPEGWTGTATELLSALNGRVAEAARKSRIWPVTAQGLGNRIARVAPLLRTKGFAVERRHSGDRTIVIVPPKGS